ncbi:hypothetical protein [Deinococcus arenicola]|uniref:Lipoprotein n=1 Tax=Deinococcus arenicola TaxID=2994950 RepID=A0ABU4DRA6_9DEIO|nr:hypothetical protein [Deinococcus sp. ZS9-10]MDV6374497.1 hypothetical protein [Deinococcus sp. ZS9-10]
MKSSLALILLPALLLAACGNKATPLVSGLSGVVADGGVSVDASGKYVVGTSSWTGGAGKVGLSMAGTAQELANTTLATDGKFSFAALPTPPEGSLTTAGFSSASPDCTGTVNISDSKVLGGTLTLNVSASKSGTIAQVAVNGSDNSLQTLSPTYVNGPLTINGVQTCSANGLSVVNDIDVKMTKGWNPVLISSQVSAAVGKTTVKTTIRNGSIGTGAKWYLTGSTTQPQGLGSFKLPTSIFR